MPRIDIHHHFFPAAGLMKQRSVGWTLPPENFPWTPAISLKFLADTGIDAAILSIPAYSEGSVSPENRMVARKHNEYAAEICARHPGKFGFFANLPFLDDVEGALIEITYAFDVLHADGVGLSTTIGEGPNGSENLPSHGKKTPELAILSPGYLGDDKYDPIWEELNRRKAVVFVHGAQSPSSTPWPNKFLGLPVTEVPNETYKAAAHLVVTGKKRRYSDVKIILSHMGGSTVILASRVAGLSPYMGCTLTPDEIMEDFKSFYFDTALASCETNLIMIESFAQPDRLLFGTDFPVTTETTKWYTTHLERFYGEKEARLQEIVSKNALKLFPRFDSTVYV
ncbi:amidohydrolase 2 [Armillaria solidipes]|uniref:Amidohydrolase 2 n=1 Tax=Armillaria solidipes TaxID=1076256 RepID=A0A2H3BP45_9AGAR|nr:amidohydrolase 2 [Armillaria solidipes]